MDKVYIKYNPYKVTTEIRINDQPVKKYSKLNVGEKRLQEWIDNLPNYLYKERNTKNFEIVFQGTDFDYEDVKQITEEANKKCGFNIILSHVTAKRINPKDILAIYNKIQKGPFDELKTESVERAFKLANSKEFEVNVIATMSAGKSTLINALLGQKLMPARHEATTATITRIRDNDRKVFTARAYNESGKLFESCPALTYQKMNRLNDNPEVCDIEIEGDIPFVTSDEVSLVLIDTPGPNNARNPKHGVTTRRMLSNSSKSLVLYVLNANQAGITDDSDLLDFVAKNMQVNGKQSRDRFIFVLNQLDEFWGEEDDIKREIEKTRTYLEKKGIHNPSIYPTSAKTALSIRTILKNITDMKNVDGETLDIENAKILVKRSVNVAKLHLEKNAPVPKNVQMKIENLLNEGIKNKDLKQQSLVHSGIISLEEGIKLYVEKYATPLKIKTISDSFLSKVETARTFEKLKEDINSSEEKRIEIENIIRQIEEKLNNGDAARRFKEQIESLNSESIINDDRINEILSPVNAMKRSALQKASAGRLKEEEAKKQYSEYAKLARKLHASVITDLEDLVENEVINKTKLLLEQYKKQIVSLTDGIHMETVDFNPFKLVEGDIPTDVSEFIEKSKRSEKGKGDWEFSPGISFFNGIAPWKWVNWHLFERGDLKYVDAETLAQEYFSKVESELHKNVEEAKKYTKKEINTIQQKARDEFEKINCILQDKMNQLKAYQSEKRLTESELEKLHVRQQWLTDIKTEIEQMLEI